MRKTLLILAALAGTLSAETICGKRFSTADTDLVHVGCIDYSALAALGVPIPPSTPKTATQVLIHAKSGAAVRVVVDGEVQFADLLRDAYGRLVSLVIFAGSDHQDVTVEVLDKRQ